MLELLFEDTEDGHQAFLGPVGGVEARMVEQSMAEAMHPVEVVLVRQLALGDVARRRHRALWSPWRPEHHQHHGQPPHRIELFECHFCFHRTPEVATFQFSLLYLRYLI